ncbi:MAG: glycoside hydrolase family 3 C-terminal domain-containing protein, partial [Armatimonadota bacterium]|nr:glycoside hydrolase family 3 C-terminal domain-containing protein [Armatimonadota bacterium]
MAQSDSRVPGYKNVAEPIKKRVADLLSRMTLEQKVSQMYNSAGQGERACRLYRSKDGNVPVCLCWTTAIEELDVASHDWWNEALHGCASSWVATVFPQAIGMAAAWNPELLHRVATAISDEARAKHHDSIQAGATEPHTGLTYWSPNINIFRDPRWGRGQETYGEDPYLTARLGVAFVRGLQGSDPRYLKTVATPKHFAAHSGPEKMRHSFDSQVSERDMRETYLPAFRACVKEGGAASVMSAYDRTNGEACSASKTLLIDVLRKEWGFEGFVVSDCGAVADIYQGHRLVDTAAEASALAVKNGCDLNCGEAYRALVEAVEQGLIEEAEIDEALGRALEARFKLGMFDPPEMVPYAQIPIGVVDCEQHRELALEMARQSIVLLKNDGEALPLGEDVTSVAVIGPNADSVEALLGNYAGTPSKAVTVLEGIRDRVDDGVAVLYAKGCELNSSLEGGLEEAVAAAREADVAVVVLGLSVALESEENQAWESEIGDDRADLDLPGSQEEMLKAVHATGTPVVAVLLTGSALSVNWADEHIPAILNAWYPGEEGGHAVADVLLGRYNPAGRLPVTFYKSVEQLPEFTNYSMVSRTYRYFTGEPLYPFGYGLSYTRFRYSNLSITPSRPEAG